MRAAILLALAACGYPQPQRLNGDGGHDAPKKDAAPDAPPPFVSCTGLQASCGPSSGTSCCATNAVQGGVFDRGYDTVGDGMYNDMTHAATVSNFRLDVYEVTVARFRGFIDAQQGTQEHPPRTGSGAHAAIPNSGWDASWTANLAANTAALRTDVKCESKFTFTDTSGANDTMPINCVSWYEAMAFCIWDGGYLPTEAEWNYAASGGNMQRAYPWSSPPASTSIGCGNAKYTDTACATTAPIRAGTDSPAGDSAYGQSDMAGNVWEWVLDADVPYPDPCQDCAALSGSTQRVIRGGNFESNADGVRANVRNALTPDSHHYVVGMRCARPM